jgi:Na+-transporting methylmalonyl-CoA/oxaloacetate decarboxylase gamma subunit
VLTLVVVTAAVLGMTLVVALIAVLAFLSQIRRFLGDTAATLESIDHRANRLAERVGRIQQVTRAAAGELSRMGT